MDSPVCDSYVRPETLVRICDECNFGTYGGRCIICGSPGEYFVLSYPIIRLLPYHLSRSRQCPPSFCFAHIYGFSSSFSGISDAYYCAECTRLEKDRDGCPKIVNLGASRTDLFYERRRLGFKKG
ncbi:PHF5-like protein-domain-containing protein [Russula dissimulans]|nr:PHF5-like protein-domain-containing protein [Russula dissimulans]